MEIKFKLNNTVQAFHFTDVLLHNGFSFRVLTEMKKIEMEDGNEFYDKVYTIFVTVNFECKEVPF